jgi:hypothetical protein
MKIVEMHKKGEGSRVPVCIVTVSLIVLMFNTYSLSSAMAQKGFPSTEEAVTALVAAVRENNEKELRAILGPGSGELISSGDEVADRRGREKFLKAYETMNTLEQGPDNTMVLHIGADSWAMPIPIVKKGTQWVFDTGKGKEEILNRRIGRNELHVIEVLNAYVDAQHEYATRDYGGSSTVEFAQRLISTKGERDGLYWEAKEGQAESPLGPLIARAAREGYGEASNLSPFHGYFFRILKGQGEHAGGGGYDYVVKGKMILGFALVAYPAAYENSGVMTFMVNQEGTIYEKNLGKNTKDIAEDMKLYDPDETWKKVRVEVSAKQ